MGSFAEVPELPAKDISDDVKAYEERFNFKIPTTDHI